MTTSRSRVVHIKQTETKQVLSKSQKLFNNLIKKIAVEKKLLQEWQTAIPSHYQKVATDYEPLLDVYNNKRVEMVTLLDQAFSNKTFRKMDKVKMSHLICEITSSLIRDYDYDDLKAMHDKYSEESFDVIEEDANLFATEFFKEMAQTVYGIDLDEDDDIRSPEQLHAKLREKLASHNPNESQQNFDAFVEKPKSKKQLAKEAKLQKEEQTISQSIREVYRKLTSALHPDREQDPSERERKTLIMQKVNIAYGKKDLLSLLELQLEVEQIDQAHLNNIAEDRLKSFNRILNEQLTELQQEIHHLTYPFAMELSRFGQRLSTPKALEKLLQQDIASIKKDITGLEQDILAFKNINTLKAWLKNYRIPEPDDFSDFMFD